LKKDCTKENQDATHASLDTPGWMVGLNVCDVAGTCQRNRPTVVRLPNRGLFSGKGAEARHGSRNLRGILLSVLAITIIDKYTCFRRFVGLPRYQTGMSCWLGS
jgi:hypothetical protein